MTLADDGDANRLKHITDLSENEIPTDRADVHFILEKSDARLGKDVEVTRGRGIRSLVTTVIAGIGGLTTGLLTNFDVSHSTAAKVVIILGAVATVALGSSIGFFLSIPEKQRRRRDLKAAWDQTITIRGNVTLHGTGSIAGGANISRNIETRVSGGRQAGESDE